MKKLILLVPFILMACGESASEKLEREHIELKAKTEKENAVINERLSELGADSLVEKK